MLKGTLNCRGPLRAVLCVLGLDARAAAIVMRTVRNTVNTGRTVVCTIHQPSIDIFEVSYTRPNSALPARSYLCQHLILPMWCLA